MKRLWIAAVAAVATVAMIAIPNAATAATTSVTVAGQTRTVNGTNIYRATNYLVVYTPARGATTGTNQYGYEAAVVNGVVTQVANSVGNMAIPSNGFVLSGHGTSRTWLQTYAKVGATVTLNDGSTPPPTSPPPTTPPTGTEKLPDMGIRTLRQFSIVNTGGKKLLKFPGVTANVGTGPLEVRASRSSSTSTDWVAHQWVKTSTGDWKDLGSTGQEFYFGGDGHNHWHMKDFDGYYLFDPSGKKQREGEKHGFCFEDNTSYRDWPSTGKNGTPASPVYLHDDMCGFGKPSATSILHGLSVGYADTYPATLPDQAIDITGLPDGNYTVEIKADQGNWIKESNENNNSATALVKINGNTVTLLSANNGL